MKFGFDPKLTEISEPFHWLEWALDQTLGAYEMSRLTALETYAKMDSVELLKTEFVCPHGVKHVGKFPIKCNTRVTRVRTVA